MLKILLTLLAEFWKPISLFLGGLGLYGKGWLDKRKSDKIKDLEAEVDANERLRNVKTNTDRDAALERLRKSGHVRED